MALAPLGFQRGFVRVEISHWDGQLMAFEQREPTPVQSPGARVVALETGHHTPLAQDKLRRRTNFVQLQRPCMAM